MKMRKLVSFLSLIAIVTFLVACEDSKNTEQPTIKEKEVVSSITKINEKTYAFEVLNNTANEITFNFTSGQRYDYKIYNENNEVVYQFGAVAMFIQALGEENLPPSEKLHYPIELTQLGLTKGSYKLEVWLTASETNGHGGVTDYAASMDIEIN
jgi:hypothetical protein